MSIEYMESQFKTMLALQSENDALKAEIIHLKQLLISKDNKFEPSNEEAICQIQIEKLRDKAFQRELTLEETKRLEILVKSMHAIRDKEGRTVEADYKVLPSLSNIAALSLIAGTPDEQPESD